MAKDDTSISGDVVSPNQVRQFWGSFPITCHIFHFFPGMIDSQYMRYT